MSTDTRAIHIASAREAYKLLDDLDRHINNNDASGRALLYEAKEHIRMLIINIDKSAAE